jgi:magnesium transporter
VVDQTGKLIDDIITREFLLAPLDKRGSDLMDYRYVALSAMDSQESTIPVFRSTNRKAWPISFAPAMAPLNPVSCAST